MFTRYFDYHLIFVSTFVCFVLIGCFRSNILDDVVRFLFKKNLVIARPWAFFSQASSAITIEGMFICKIFYSNQLLLPILIVFLAGVWFSLCQRSYRLKL